jgi:predicted NAD-dependent protein-ADP-ribosyltransferase YbiA (DUF1768 family)
VARAEKSALKKPCVDPSEPSEDEELAQNTVTVTSPSPERPPAALPIADYRDAESPPLFSLDDTYPMHSQEQDEDPLSVVLSAAPVQHQDRGTPPAVQDTSAPDVIIVKENLVHHSAAVSPSVPAQQPMVPDFLIVKGANDPLSNFYPCSLDCDGVRTKSAEHVLHLVRAVKGGNFDLAGQIWRSPDAPHVKRAVRECPIPLPNDLNFDICLMRNILDTKFEQCVEFRDALRASGNALLLHSTYMADKVWATGLDHRDRDAHVRCLIDTPSGFPGRNVHGQLLMELRAKHFGTAASPVPVLVSPNLKKPLLQMKPPSLLDVRVDERFIAPWLAKHGMIPPGFCHYGTDFVHCVPHCPPYIGVPHSSHLMSPPPFHRFRPVSYRV